MDFGYFRREFDACTGRRRGGGAGYWPGRQSLIRDFISGLFIILEGQFAVGDYVSIGGVCGTVEELGLRVTVLRDFYGHRHYFPNGSIAIVKVYEEPYVQWKVELQVPQEKSEEAAAELMAVVDDLSMEFPDHITGWAPPRETPCMTTGWRFRLL